MKHVSYCTISEYSFLTTETFKALEKCSYNVLVRQSSSILATNAKCSFNLSSRNKNIYIVYNCNFCQSNQYILCHTTYKYKIQKNP